MNLQRIARGLKKDYEKKLVITLKDMKALYEDKMAVQNILKRRNPVIYEVYIKSHDKKKDVGLTVLNSGKIAGEYYMTKGHKHKKAFSEIYFLIKGKGKIVMQKHNCKVIDLKKGKKFLISGDAGHRVINFGKEKIEFLAIYNKKSGHNYSFKFKKRVKE
ncbi:MAG: glucose-6-phosphate isomerase family protein [archaeon]